VAQHASHTPVVAGNWRHPLRVDGNDWVGVHVTTSESICPCRLCPARLA
jgi:hypothetical protein